MHNSLKNIEDLKLLLAKHITVRINAKVIPNSKINSIEFGDDFIKIKIKEKPIEGKANKAVINFLKDILSIPKTRINILHGEKSSLKVIEFL